MAVIIYGSHEYGKVDEHAGEYAVTRFFHLWWLPLFPTGSTWIAGRTSEGAYGHGIKLHGKSVLAGYLRVWGPLVALGNAIAVLETPGLGHAIATLVSIALVAWTWSWRSLRTERARRRSDFNFVAFGVRCEPRRMRPEQRALVKRDLEARWQAQKPDGSPNDVARHGAKDPAQAVLAYGLLRLAAAERGRAGAAEDGEADAILDGTQVPSGIVDGPYRGAQTAATGSAPSGATLADLVEVRLAERVAANPDLVPTKADLETQFKRKRRRYRLGLGVATFMSLGAIVPVAMALQPTIDVGITELRAVKPPTTRLVRVDCSAIDGPLWEETTSRGRSTAAYSMCTVGRYLLPIKHEVGETLAPGIIEGKLSWIDTNALWVREGLATEPELEARSLDVYLDTDGKSDRVFSAFIGALFVLGTPLLWVAYRRWRRRMLAAIAAAQA